MSESPPERGPKHEALKIFLGEWTASGTSYGGTDQSGDPHADGNRRQEVQWEWKPDDRWLPLCDRVAVRIDG